MLIKNGNGAKHRKEMFMKKKILFALIALPMAVTFLASCSVLHVHTFTSPYEYDETSHWKTCSICHEKFDQHSHVFNEIDDKCFICDHTDQLVYLNEKREVIGLTPYGKTKLTLNIPNKVGEVEVKGIAPFAFKDSDAVTVKLNEGLDYYYETSFSDSHVKTIATEEDMVNWDEPDSEGKIKKIRVFKNNTAKIGNNYYETLQDAFNAVELEDTTITLLRDRYDLLTSAPIEVSHSIILEPLYANTMLSCDFDITNNGIIYIPDTIVYEGNARLLLTEVRELRGSGYTFEDRPNTYETVYSSGSIVFVNKDECPIGVNVTYVKSFRDIGSAGGYPAIGAKQVANELLLIPHKHFAFGTVRFDKDIKIIKGITKYGETVTDLTLTSPIKGKKVVIGENAFAVGYKITVSIPAADDIKFWMFRTKGFFTHLTIGEGITKILSYAFTNRLDSDVPFSVVEQLPIAFSHLRSVKIGDDLEEIGYEAFYDNVSLTEVVGGARLKKICKRAFAGELGGISLTTADFSHSYNLNNVHCAAFHGCKKLSYLSLPPGSWKAETGESLESYFPYDTTPERIAYIFSNRSNDAEGWWTKVSPSDKPIYYTKSDKKDSLGKFCDVGCTNNLEEAIWNCTNGGELYISDGYNGTHTITLSDFYVWESKSISINVAPKFKDFVVKSHWGDDITVWVDQFLMLTNIKPKGTITLSSFQDGEKGVKNLAGFAIRGVDSSYKPKVNINAGDLQIQDLLSTEANIYNETYDAYGIFNFDIRNDGQGDYTYIKDTSKFGDKATSITYAHQVEGAERVIADNGSTRSNNVTHVTISSDVESIKGGFFQNFDKLEKVTIDEGLKTIGNEAFGDCDGLTSVTLPNSLTSLGKEAFRECRKLVSVNIPAGLTSISEKCFYECDLLESITIPNNIISIKANAFEGCDALTTIKFPTSLVNIGENAFKGCKELSKIYIPDNSQLTTIGANAFSNCTNLAFAYFGENTTTGWTVPGDPDPTDIDPEELSDSSKAAVLLKTTHVAKEWTRTAPNL